MQVTGWLGRESVRPVDGQSGLGKPGHELDPQILEERNIDREPQCVEAVLVVGIREPAETGDFSGEDRPSAGNVRSDLSDCCDLI